MALNLGAGKYATKVTIEQPSTTVGGYNDPQYSWTTYASRWAQVETNSGRELQRAQQTMPETTAVIRMRSDSTTRAITPRMRCKIGNRVLNIAVANDEGEMRQEVVLWVTEVFQ